MSKLHLADILKTGITNLPNWVNISLLHLNPLREGAYGSAYRRFKAGIPTLNPDKMLINMANHAIKNVPFYRKRYQGLVISSVEQFKREFEFISRADIDANWEDFVVDNCDRSKTVFKTTSGTSGVPLRMLIPANRYVTEMSFVNQIWRRCGWNFDVRATIRGAEMSEGQTYRVNPVTREFIFDSHRLCPQYAADIHKIMHRHHIKTIYSYPSVACNFLKLCLNQGLDTSFIKYALLSSEAVTKDQFVFLTKTCGISIAFTYGHTEKLILAGNDHGTELKVEQAYGYTELIDDAGNDITTPGGYGELVGSTLYNYYFPLLRYRTDDYATLARLERSPYGYDEMWLTSIDGRHAFNALLRADGTTTTETAIILSDDFYTHIEGLQYIQTREGYVTVCVIPGNGYTTQDSKYLLNQTAHVMGGADYVELKEVSDLQTMPNGKFLPVLNYLLNPALSQRRS